MNAMSPAVRRFGWSPRSFRAKFVFVVAAAVLFALLVSGGFALWNVNQLSRDATQEIARGLTKANQEYIQNYIDTMALRADLAINRVHSEVTALAGAMQALIDHPEARAAVGEALKTSPYYSPPLVYDEQGKWAQNNAPGSPSVTSVWGYLLGPDHAPLPDVARDIQESAIFDVLGNGVIQTGAKKLQVYYVGPKSGPIFRTVPYTEQAQTFDKLYPGHNEADFWDFFFPGAYEDWQSWLKDPKLRPVADDITRTAPYTDAITGKLIVSFFHPLWTKDRKDVAGMVGADVSLDQLAEVVESVKLAETGFAFLTMANGNVLAITPAGEKTLGLTIASGAGQGVTALDRSLPKSTQPEVAALTLPTDDNTEIKHIRLNENGGEQPYLVALRRLEPDNLWTGTGHISRGNLALGFVVPEREIYASLFAAQADISAAAGRIVQGQAATLAISLLLVVGAVFLISKPITAGLRQLAGAARRLKDKDYSVRVNIPSRDEVGEVGVAFNSMAEEIRYHTENLERKVTERTRELGEANKEILSLNEQLKSENLRLGAELDVARQVQQMVLPKSGELQSIPRLDIATYMEPADEIGGDYYDVLQSGDRVKIGIGDVTGHGLASGVLMLMVQSVARALQEDGEDDPRKFLSVLNRAIFKNIERMEADKSLSLGFVDYHDRHVTLSGQHEEVLIIRHDGTLERINTIDLGFPIGLEFDVSAFIATVDLPFTTDDTMILYTDGITEAESPDGALYGLDRLCESATRHRSGRADEIKKGVIDDLMAHIGTQKIHDDITLVVLKHN